MTQGYIILAQNTDTVDYVRQAYALALSIKNTQSTVKSVAIATNSVVDEKYKYAFDHIVDIPWIDSASASDWKIENKWKYYYMTPFDETVILDADMIFTTDISHWWPIMGQREIALTTSPKTFRGDTITSTRYRPTFKSNDLPNVYTTFMYFKKTYNVGELFKLINIIFHNWEHFYYTYLDETRPTYLSGDVAYAIAIKILGLQDECFEPNLSIPSFVHMKSYVQNLDNSFASEDWTAHLPTYMSPDGGIMLGNYKQVLPFHYQVKTWLTDDIIDILETKALSWKV